MYPLHLVWLFLSLIFRSEDKDNSSYRLSGVIEHIGDSLHSGHNVAYVRASTIGSGSSLWFRASDDHISQVSLEEVLKCEVYVLFYERMEG
jgi:ubiquitin carboxyl-terminal hydrolase 16/45